MVLEAKKRRLEVVVALSHKPIHVGNMHQKHKFILKGSAVQTL